ncbi:MAG TPA: glycoside hydrolase family 32 protein, partial [Chloroflexota bacterium]|nr:glycoside hydrolase family 32 protein [Chloroflexota bacterium]
VPIAERSRYHFQPSANWMSDPNGPIHWRGQYHLFYQHNPRNPFFGPMCWGHAVSPDLVRWAHLPIALAPTPGGPDADGCWSGCAVDDAGTPTLIYTGVVKDEDYQANYRQTQCLAISDDNLLTWRKDPRNPIIPGPPEGDDIMVTGFRDPCVWREADGWACVVGSGVEGVGGHILLYRSPDLHCWDYVGRLYSRPCQETSPVWTGSIFECPQFFPLGDRHVLIFAVWDQDHLHHTVAMVGDFDGRAFTPRDMRRLDLGPDYYAPSVMLDARGRRVLWGWVREARRRRVQLATGWAGMMSLPRVLNLRSDGGLGVVPAPELEALRRDHRRWRDLMLSPDAANPLDEVRGDSLEIRACLDLGEASSCTLALRRSPDDEERTLVRYERETGALVVDRDRSSLDPAARRGSHGGPIPPGEDGFVTLHVFLDRTIVEVYANGHGCITERIYPTRPDSLGISLEAEGGVVSARTLDIWTIASASDASPGY